MTVSFAVVIGLYIGHETFRSRPIPGAQRRQPGCLHPRDHRARAGLRMVLGITATGSPSTIARPPWPAPRRKCCWPRLPRRHKESGSAAPGSCCRIMRHSKSPSSSACWRPSRRGESTLGSAAPRARTGARPWRSTRMRPRPRMIFPAQFRDLQAWSAGEELPVNHPFRGVYAQPAGPHAPEIWVLGSSNYGAQVAAYFGLPYCFAYFFSDGRRRAAGAGYLPCDFQPLRASGGPAFGHHRLGLCRGQPRRGGLFLPVPRDLARFSIVGSLKLNFISAPGHDAKKTIAIGDA